jgi:hypothetical protein
VTCAFVTPGIVLYSVVMKYTLVAEVEDAVSVLRRSIVGAGGIEIVLIALALAVQRRPVRIVKQEGNIVTTIQQRTK